MNTNISPCEICARCGTQYKIDHIYICLKCGKMLCEDCKLYLGRHTEEVNFSCHYCNKDGNEDIADVDEDDEIEPGELVILYNKKI